MERTRLIEKVLDRCGQIAVSPLEDSLQFGRRTIQDPNTGDTISIEGYSIEANDEVLTYIDVAALTLSRYFDCLKDLLFLEEILSVERLPEFATQEQIAHYFKLNYQGWLIKTETIFDCTGQALNAVYELGFRPRSIGKKQIIDSELKNHPDIFQHIDKLSKILMDTVSHIQNFKKVLPIREERNLLIHQNEFEHAELAALEGDVMFFRYGMLDIDEFQIQATIGATGDGLKREIEAVNSKIVEEVYPIFEYVGEEYNRRFKAKLKS